jgi:hypothetical protein
MRRKFKRRENTLLSKKLYTEVVHNVCLLVRLCTHTQLILLRAPGWLNSFSFISRNFLHIETITYVCTWLQLNLENCILQSNFLTHAQLTWKTHFVVFSDFDNGCQQGGMGKS